VFDPLEAMRPTAVQIHDNVASYDGAPHALLAAEVHNGLTRLTWRKGDIERAFSSADLILEHTFRVPARHQGYIEPHACVVSIQPKGRLQVWVCTKQPFGVRAQLSKVLGIPEERIRINVVHVGGDFGGKGDILDLTVAYFLAQQTQRPVKIVMTSAEELLASNPAHATVVTVRSGVNRDGRIVARDVCAAHASGAYGGLKANASLSTGHYIGGPYRVDNASFEFLQIYTNTVPGGYFRGPGALATYFALESHTDIIARELGIDPASFRLMNLLGEGEEDAIGQRLQSVRFREVLQAALDAAGWTQPKPGPNYGRGVAMFGRHIGGGPTGLMLTAERDGTFTVLSAIFDQGSGTHTILRQLVAEEMQVPIEQVLVVIGDTDTTPYDAGTRASRMTYVAGRAALRACEQLRAQLIKQAARILECAAEEVHYSRGIFSLRDDPGQRVELKRVIAQNGDAHMVTIVENAAQPDHVTYICAQVAEVKVDPETGRITVERFVTTHDVGTIMNPMTHQGQIEGGVIMGLGHTLMEELVLDRGRVINTNLGDYKLPTIADIPKLQTVLLSSGGGLGPYEAKSIGELVNNSAAAAVANAVADAVGVRLFELPITSERIYYALKNAGHNNDERNQS
jgi:CO/xanthine dehydrogenase Mo-binding subunit